MLCGVRVVMMRDFCGVAENSSDRERAKKCPCRISSNERVDTHRVLLKHTYIIIMSAPTTASTHTHMGTPPPGYNEEWVIHTIHCHGFGSLPSAEEGVEAHDFVDLPEFMLLGNQWSLEICPGGYVHG